ncbi:hypothetical protein PI124_g12702 [Phytophthora idaei]|nr:hypothetical protein PI125_g12735 [Phytophthora idaei]KAG3150363.1 hypothetical protein PI126_g11546 [Phytophthora idaei]KAG3242458.1 hypothetical protein PI124_g12702 [Phytophthora idaei]
MVYSNSRVGTRALIRTAVVCALSLSVIPAVRADGSSSSSAAEVCGVSDGDKSVGIRVVQDTACASGGLGCYNDHCRFCKLLETPQSSAFENCTVFGVDFPTMAPLVASTGTCEVSSGDAAVGISAFADGTCLYGGLGCFNDHCRFCKETATAQSEAFVDCLGNSAAGSATDAPVDTSSSDSSNSSVDTDVCTLVPPAGDVEVGISIGTDATCKAGGLGCINDVCRFCRIRTTTKSLMYSDCSFLGTSDANAGTTVTPIETPAATTEAPLDVIDSPTATPVATTEAPADSTDASAATTEAPAPASTTAAPLPDTCTITPSVGDSAVGISIAYDPTCVSGGVGCVTDVCRFCRVTTSPQSAAFTDCALLATDASTSSVPVVDNSALADDSDSTAASGAVADTPAVTETPAATTATPDATTEAPTEAPAGETCTQTVSEGDAAVGINIFTDASCSTGGAGCIDSICRFCKTTETPQSAAFVDCPSDTSTATTAPAATDAVTDAPTEAPTDAPTEVPTEAPTAAATEAPTETPTGETCTQTVSEGDAAVGINIFTDASCSTGGAGCIDSICRFCKTTETPQSAAFVDCPSDTSTATTAPAATDAVTDAPTEAPTDAPTEVPTEAPTAAATEAPTETPTGETCTQTVSEGDAAVGINIVTDTSCSTGGVGCIDSVCRFCKVTESEQSASFVECTSIAGTTSVEALTDNAVAETSTQSIASEANAEILSEGQIGAAIAGCVGAIAAIAIVARAAKRSSTRTANPNEPADDDEVDETESGKRVSPGPVPTEEPATAEA